MNNTRANVYTMAPEMFTSKKSPSYYLTTSKRYPQSDVNKYIPDGDVSEVWSYLCNPSGKCSPHLYEDLPHSITPQAYELALGDKLDKVTMVPPGHNGLPTAGISNIPNKLLNPFHKWLGVEDKFSPLHTYTKDDAGEWADRGAYVPPLDKFLHKYRIPLAAAGIGATGAGLYGLYRWLQSKKEDEEKKAYEEPGSTFTHDGEGYNLETLLQALQSRTPSQSPVKDLSWLLAEAQPQTDPGRLEAADVTAPVVVAPDKQGRPTVVDGMHRLTKAVGTGVSQLPSHAVTAEELAQHKLPSEKKVRD